MGKDLVWDDPDIVYWLHDDITVPMGLSLQVDAGQIVKPRYTGAELLVDGSLTVSGTAERPVVFTSAADDLRGGDSNGDGNATSPNRGDWGRINLRAGSTNHSVSFLRVTLAAISMGTHFKPATRNSPSLIAPSPTARLAAFDSTGLTQTYPI
jgi:hypothetical protein